MRSLLKLSYNQNRVVDQLSNIGHQLLRLADAVDRLSPPSTNNSPPPRRAELSDLRFVNPDTILTFQERGEQQARATNSVPYSEHFYKSLSYFEKEVEAVYGKEAVNELPWNQGSQKKDEESPP